MKQLELFESNAPASKAAILRAKRRVLSALPKKVLPVKVKKFHRGRFQAKRFGSTLQLYKREELCTKLDSNRVPLTNFGG